MPDALNLPAAMVEAAAEVISIETTGFFQFNGPDIRDHFRTVAEKALTAALAGCEIREDFGARTQWLETPDDDWLGPRDEAQGTVNRQRTYSAMPADLVRRLVITTPAEEVPDAG